MSNSIEKQIELKAPLSRVWRALTDYREFGEWFRVKLDGPFVTGELSRGSHHLSWLRAYTVGSQGRLHKTGNVLFFHLASVCRGSEDGLFG
jgi:hypothetical protein